MSITFTTYKQCKYCSKYFFTNKDRRVKCDDCAAITHAHLLKSQTGLAGVFKISGDVMGFQRKLAKKSEERNFTNPLRIKKGKYE